MHVDMTGSQQAFKAKKHYKNPNEIRQLTNLQRNLHFQGSGVSVRAIYTHNLIRLQWKSILGKDLEVVSLDDMDWFEFEQFVARLFEKLGIGKAKEIRKGNDAGKDIILRSP
jgi:HJR/Mrr/RecB family endonuclease